jgi:hypothetical protein
MRKGLESSYDKWNISGETDNIVYKRYWIKTNNAQKHNVILILSYQHTYILNIIEVVGRIA